MSEEFRTKPLAVHGPRKQPELEPSSVAPRHKVPLALDPNRGGRHGGGRTWGGQSGRATVGEFGACKGRVQKPPCRHRRATGPRRKPLLGRRAASLLRDCEFCLPPFFATSSDASRGNTLQARVELFLFDLPATLSFEEPWQYPIARPSQLKEGRLANENLCTSLDCLCPSTDSNGAVSKPVTRGTVRQIL